MNTATAATPATTQSPNLLSIAGSDPSGGAGIQADLKTFSALGCYGMAVVTALTAQNTQGVRATHLPPADFVGAQIDAIFEDVEVAAVKIGMLGSAETVGVVADRLARFRPAFVTLDPVLAATSGDALAGEGVEAAIIERLFPLVSLVTPNLDEARRLAGVARPLGRNAMREAADRLMRLGARAVLVKGGDAGGETSEDFFLDAETEEILSAPRVNTRNTHGTGCTLSSAIAAFRARGEPMLEAIVAAKAYVTGALRGAGALRVGREGGHGPMDHFFAARGEGRDANP
ncbi:bifunctional hydroxymethylpyrimidine kinase/phosphomethylpyrimidine kinase [Methylocella sp.]|uniref:bifunctional hydroxymethylpyrimidine kinase/phosphomethylpyrimidine kinase n=1 Tax=Methylocella sp. TaxID=1978226 RepID=UPI003782FB6A